MHLVFQFPIIDCRPLLNNNEVKLAYPEWGNLGASSKRFIRKFGAVSMRSAGGSDDWPGEGFYCNAHLAMRYKNLHKLGYPLDEARGVRTNIFKSYRRYASSEDYLGRIEAGFVDNTEQLIEQLDIKEASLESMIHHYGNLPVTIDGASTRLSSAGSRLAKMYYRSSTPANVQVPEKSKLVQAGDVLVLAVFTKSDAFRLPPHTSLIEAMELPGTTEKLNLYGCRLRHNDMFYKVWLIEMPFAKPDQSAEVREMIRNLRINLLRIHLEKETMRHVLSAIKTRAVVIEPGSEQAKAVDRYFEKTGKKIFSHTRYTIRQKNLLDFALRSDRSSTPDTFSQLEEGIYNFKNTYIRENVNKILDKMARKIILFICTSPNNKSRTKFEDEYREIKRALRNEGNWEAYDIEIETSVRKNELMEHLEWYQPEYLHFCMHNTLKEGLYFEDDQKDPFPMPVTEFAAAIQSYAAKVSLTPLCIILSACNSEAHAEAIKAYCDHVIGTRRVFPADAGIIYAAAFYKTFFAQEGSDIPKCHEAGRAAIQNATIDFGTYDIPVYDIPVLINKNI
ncbi:hypothetical protein ABDK00_012595 [Niabella insulamsoli]|uniref:hypothetical protein n=1 Tax=Niabella insulamsoli TaxID=3144874 RepID=UPI0031FDEC7A